MLPAPTSAAIQPFAAHQAGPAPVLCASSPHRSACLQVYTSITPAWNNDNLNRLATKLESGVIFAHVRAAYPGMPVSKEATHPFQWGEHACVCPACGRGCAALCASRPDPCASTAA